MGHPLPSYPVQPAANGYLALFRAEGRLKVGEERNWGSGSGAISISGSQSTVSRSVGVGRDRAGEAGRAFLNRRTITMMRKRMVARTPVSTKQRIISS